MDADLIRVAIIDDHLMFAESLGRLLNDETDITVVGTMSTGHDALRELGAMTVHVALVDYHLPDMTGAQLAQRLLAVHPGLNIIVVTGANDDQLMLTAIEVGCAGFLTKSQTAAQVADAVRAVAAGEALISTQTLTRLLSLLKHQGPTRGGDLTNRERDLLARMASGASNQMIADEMFLSVNTVRNYTQSILAKLGAHSKLEAVSMAVSSGIISYPLR